MDTTMIPAMIWATAALIGAGLVGGLALVAWRDWLEFKRLAIGRAIEPAPNAGARIELADLRERVRRLEAIAAGVDL